MEKKILVFGNPLIKEDSLALKVMEQLKIKVQDVEFEAVESLDEAEEMKDLYIMDVASGLEKVEVLQDLDLLNVKHPISGHDFDLAMELKMRKKVGRIGKVVIVAIPSGYKIGKAVEEVEKLIPKIFSNSL